MLDAWCLVLGVWCLVSGVWCVLLVVCGVGSWCLVFGVWCVIGVWSLVWLVFVCLVFVMSVGVPCGWVCVCVVGVVCVRCER